MKVLVAALADSRTNPRPNRVISSLKDYADITFLGYGGVCSENTGFVEICRKEITFFEKIIRLSLLKLGFEKYYINYIIPSSIVSEIKKKRFDIIICHDLLLLAVLMLAQLPVKVIFDAREFYPKHFEDRFFWKFFLQGFNEKLCKEYLPKTDYSFTVSGGLAKRYLADYNVSMEVLYSLPKKTLCKPSNVNKSKIRMIHHGSANPSRKIEIMIRCMDFVDDRFILDLMLVDCESRYYRFLEKQVLGRHNVRLIPPVPLDEIVSFSNDYDVGFFLVPPSTYNLEHCMPNKFFEFIQARLAVAVGPSPDMAQFVKKYDIGVVSSDFTPQGMAHELNSLSNETIFYYKKQSDKIANLYTADRNKKRLVELLDFFQRFQSFPEIDVASEQVTF